MLQIVASILLSKNGRSLCVCKQCSYEMAVEGRAEHAQEQPVGGGDQRKMI